MSSTESITYPDPQIPITELNFHKKILKLSRNLPCADCDGKCLGWRPAKESSGGRADLCGFCTHKLSSHRGPFSTFSSWSPHQFQSLLKIVSKIEIILLGEEKLLDYEYCNDAITSLRKEMLTIEEQQDSKASSSTLDMINISKNAEIEVDNMEIDTVIKKEEPLDNDAAEDTQEELDNFVRNKAAIEAEKGLIYFRIIKNDNTPETLELLTGLKNIFQKQLPKMPREYISKLIYDHEHVSVSLIRKEDEKIVGGITYRPFFHRLFAEIVFCAISSTEQVKGYGSFLMNNLKEHIKKDKKCKYLLTYADNYAIGYFKKQGFSKTITLEKSVWMGYIKDYEGGTIMQCTLIDKINYLKTAETMEIQKQYLHGRIRQNTKSHIVYPGIKVTPSMKKNPLEIPGLAESGWTPEMSRSPPKCRKSNKVTLMRKILSDLQSHPSSWPFMEPVSKADVPDYYGVITDPMDFQTMEFNLDSDPDTHYPTLQRFINDAMKIFKNCRTYNDPQTTYVKCANKLEKFLKDRLKDKVVVSMLEEEKSGDKKR